MATVNEAVGGFYSASRCASSSVYASPTVVRSGGQMVVVAASVVTMASMETRPGIDNREEDQVHRRAKYEYISRNGYR